MECNNSKQARRLLRLENVSLEIDKRKLLQDISFDIIEGESLVLIGPNGAGKTSLLKVIADDIQHTSGNLTFNTEQLAHALLIERARALAVLPQFSLLNFPFTVEEVVQLGRSPHKSGARIDKEIVNHALASMDMLDMRHVLYTQLSGGEKQRTQIARVMSQVWRAEDADARLLLLDEPSAALDVSHQNMLANLIEEQRKSGLAIITVAHGLNFAAQFATKILALKGGKIFAYGDIETVFNQATLTELYDTPLHIVPHPTTHQPCVI